jgi:hypothetical protein
MFRLTFLAALLAFPAPPADTVRIDAAAGSRVWIEGGSNIADWSCTATKFEARVDSTHIAVRVAVRDLKCGNRRMDHDLYSALKASDADAPSWIFAYFAADAGESRGTIEVAGIERVVNARIETSTMPEGGVRARGSIPLLMTDFGVKPPVGLFGLIRSKNAVTVKFDLLIPR